MATARERLTHLWADEPGLWGWLSTVDHKKIGKRYLVTAMAFLVVGGIEAIVVRLQLARGDQSLITPEAYDQIFTMHGVTMIFWYASPILSGFGNYLVPMLIGARDMAFPRLNALTYWTFLLSGVLLYTSVFFGEAPHAGWFAYVPYAGATYSPGRGMDFYALALVFLTISTTAGAINFIVTILRHRAPGMRLSRSPLFLYSTFTTSASIVFSLPALTVACVFLELDRRWGFHFFDVARGGDPVLWQQLFWFFGHPWVYIIFLPATGMISMLLPVFARRPIVGYRYVAAATVLTGVVGFSVWVHHMFATGSMSHGAMTFFSAASMTISVFSAIQVFAWVATLWRGRPVVTTSLLFALGFIVSLVLGGLSGVVTAVVPFDWQVHDTYFVVAHLHYVLVGANVLPVFAAFYYWLPKMTGRMLSERLGRWSFWLVFIGFNVTFFPMHVSGLLGMPRRIFTYPEGVGWDGINLAATVGVGILTIGILLSIVNFVWSLRRGPAAGKNPWNADTLEWSSESPPAPYGTVHLPTVESRHPLWDDHDEEHDPRGERILDGRRLTLSTSWRQAVPLALAKMPRETATPLALSLALTALFVALLFQLLWLAAAAAVASLLVTDFWLRPRHEKKPPPLDEGEVRHPLVDAIDERRGTWGMWLFIATEAALFGILFFAYVYLVDGNLLIPDELPPKLKFPIPMLVILVASSVVLHLGERRMRRGDHALGRAALVVTILLAISFLVLQFFEYREHLKTLTPQMRSYGSIFYTITSFHAAHLLLGLCMLVYVLFLRRPEETDRPPHRSLHNAGLYWHFVDLVWVLIVVLLYLFPHLR